MAVVARCFRQTLEIFQRAAEGKRGEEALHAIGEAYGELLESDRIYLRAQMQAYAACDDPEICAVVRDGFGDLVTYVERVSGVASEELAEFFAARHADERALLDGCRRPRTGAAGSSRAASKTE